MIFDDNIELNGYGIKQTLDKIYEFKPDFEKYKPKLERAERDIKDYMKDYKLYDVIEGIRKFLLPKVKNLLDKMPKKELKLLTDKYN